MARDLADSPAPADAFPSATRRHASIAGHVVYLT
jgi:hypothetical protein